MITFRFSFFQVHMASFSHSMSFLPLLLFSLLSSSISNNLVETTCGSTSYHDFCVATIASAGPKNSAATDARGLSAIILSLALSNATNSAAYAATLASSTASENACRPLLRACAAKYAAAGDALRWAMRELSAESYDYAFVHASAAAEYPVACRVLFVQQRRQPAETPAVYPPELGQREEDLKRLCTVAVEIISLLG